MFGRSASCDLLLFPLLLTLALNLEVLGSVRRHIVFLDREVFPQDTRVELEKHRQKVFVRSEKFFPAFDGLQHFHFDSLIDICVHEQS